MLTFLLTGPSQRKSCAYVGVVQAGHFPPYVHADKVLGPAIRRVVPWYSVSLWYICKVSAHGFTLKPHQENVPGDSVQGTGMLSGLFQNTCKVSGHSVQEECSLAR